MVIVSSSWLNFMSYNIVQVLDCKGLRCPLPMVELKKAIKKLTTGDVLQVEATDPGSRRDFESWSRKTGHTLLSAEEKDNVFVYIIRKED